MDDKQTVLEAMKAAGKPLSAGNVAEETGLERKAVDKVFAELKKTGEITSPKKCFWQPA